MNPHSYDAIVIGAGVIGLSLALELRAQGRSTLVLERGEAGREASFAAAGMLAASQVAGPPALRQMALESAAMFPDFVSGLESRSGARIDFQRSGAIHYGELAAAVPLSEPELKKLEPAASFLPPVYLLPEDFVDPRTLMAALIEAARRDGVVLLHGSEVTEILVERGRASGVKTAHSSYQAPVVVNCCGAWSAALSPSTPVRPVKGHMLCLLPPAGVNLRHAVRSELLDVYMLPRSDGRIVVGSTLEEAGFDKRVEPATILRLHQLAADLVPQLGEARIHESWTGLRPAAPDGLPLLGETALGGYFLATGHFRNGILLAPATAAAMAQLIAGEAPAFDLSPFSPKRFC